MSDPPPLDYAPPEPPGPGSRFVRWALTHAGASYVAFGCVVARHVWDDFAGPPGVGNPGSVLVQAALVWATAPVSVPLALIVSVASAARGGMLPPLGIGVLAAIYAASLVLIAWAWKRRARGPGSGAERTTAADGREP
ncbi:MAG: hypothetical protein JWO31_1977 [Phycisphaerales bacterium]|nr:hypothetical protein [Phycisphaerales bacterium]